MNFSDMLNWGLHAANIIGDAMEFLNKTKNAIPDSVKQQMPKWFGLTLDDERIFNAVLAKLDAKDQVLIKRFLYEKCKDYERNRFINIVAGMEVTQGKPEEKTEKVESDGKGKTTTTKTTKAGSPGCDCRKEFLQSFAEIIRKQFRGDLDRAYEHCVAGRMILENPLHQRVLQGFSSSVGLLKNLVLAPFGVDSLAGLTTKVTQSAGAGLDNMNAGLGDLLLKVQGWRNSAR